MRAATAILTFGLCYLSGVQSTLVHYIFLKSFPQVLRECALYYQVSNATVDQYILDLYPKDDNDLKRIIHCSLVSLGGWSDQVGLRPNVMRNFFQPAPGDTCYENRTRVCVDSALQQLDANDGIGRANAAFQCYFRQYGNVIKEDQALPRQANELSSFTQFSVLVQNLPKCVLIQYSKGDILDEPHFPELLLVWLIRGGFYSAKKGGIQLNDLYTQFGHPELATQQMQQCVATTLRQVCGSTQATQAYQIFKNCLKDYVPALQLVQDAAKALVGNDQTCGCCNDCNYPVSSVYNRYSR